MQEYQLDSITYCVGNLADRLKMSASQVYKLLRSSGVLNDYIVPCYDVLHTKQSGMSLEDALDFFYDSDIYYMMSEGIADLHCLGNGYLAGLVEEEWEKKQSAARAVQKDVNDYYQHAVVLGGQGIHLGDTYADSIVG